MPFQGDPHRTLGIPPGATLNEIRSAYRRLAKKYHPDAAGERALARFLAIQAAYELLVDGEGRLRPAVPPTPAAGRTPRPAAGSARASRDAWRARRGAGSSGGTRGAGSSGASGGTRGGAGGASPGKAPGSAGPRPASSGRPSGPKAGDGDGAGARRPSGDGAGARRPSGDGAGARRPSGDGHPGRRGTRKATPGSTTYDEAVETPLDPAWDGGSWYGAASGTYWTLNPREYADPRKHGPEYEARAWRALRAEVEAGEAGGVPGDADGVGADGVARPEPGRHADGGT
jgi:curved DNA-binding protein CbpA